jgi:hypothetical protein
VAVLDQEDAAVAQQREQRLGRDDLLLHLVAAVVDDDVEGAVLLRHGPEELRVGLVPDLHDVARVGGRLRVLVDVDADQRHLRAEEPLPHVQGPAPVDPDLEDPHRAAAIGREVPGVDGEVVDPLVQHPPGAVGAEVAEQRVVAQLAQAVTEVEGGPVALVGREVVRTAPPECVAEGPRLHRRVVVVEERR